MIVAPTEKQFGLINALFYWKIITLGAPTLASVVIGCMGRL